MGKKKPKPTDEPSDQEPDVPEEVSEDGPDEAADDYLSMLQHVQAEYLNYRKRVAREKDDVRLAVARNWAERLLPVLDNLERALAAASDAEALHSGVQMTLQAFERALEQLGVEPILTDGEIFDPNRHEAIGMVPSGDHAPGTILTEVQRGFSYGGRVLRAPRVQVAAAPPPPPESVEEPKPDTED